MAIFRLTQASDWQRDETVEINTVDELLAFVEEHGDIIVTLKTVKVGGVFSFETKKEPQIKIYDTYVE